MELIPTDRQIEFVIIKGRGLAQPKSELLTLTVLQVIDETTLVFRDRCPLTLLGTVGMNALDSYLNHEADVKENLSTVGGVMTTYTPTHEFNFSMCKLPLTRKLPSGTTTGEEEHRPYYAVVEEFEDKVNIVELRHITSYLTWNGTARAEVYLVAENKSELEDYDHD